MEGFNRMENSTSFIQIVTCCMSYKISIKFEIFNKTIYKYIMNRFHSFGFKLIQVYCLHGPKYMQIKNMKIWMKIFYHILLFIKSETFHY